jgi:hypothetical protein
MGSEGLLQSQIALFRTELNCGKLKVIIGVPPKIQFISDTLPCCLVNSYILDDHFQDQTV